ncbi:MAG: hypothetical protein AAGA32_06710 [Pseudomonadota bacterium]
MRILACLASVVFAIAQPAAAQLAGTTGGSAATGGPAPAVSGGSSALLPSSFSPTTEFVAQGGLAVRILFLGRNPGGKQLTISTQLVNTTEQPLNVALIGPAPTAIDMRGVQYALSNIAGIGRCKQLDFDWVAGCLTNYRDVLHNEHFAHLQPGATVIMPLTFTAEEISSTGFMSISMNFAVGSGDRVTDDNRSELRNFPITFPIVDLATVGANQ